MSASICVFIFSRSGRRIFGASACHGPAGVSPSPDFPNLAGQYADYVETALRHYKTGKRKNPIMAEQVKNLSDKDMRDLAAYYASLRSLTVKY